MRRRKNVRFIIDNDNANEDYYRIHVTLDLKLRLSFFYIDYNYFQH